MSSLRTLNIAIQNGIIQDLSVSGNVIGMLSASVPIFFEDENGSSFFLENGQDAIFPATSTFKRFKIWHNSPLTQNITIAIGQDAKINPNKTLQNVSIIKNTKAVVGASYLVTAASTAISTAANKNRLAIHFRNTSLTTDVYLAAFAAATKGDCPIRLMPNECLLVDDITAAAAWVAFSDGGNITLASQEATE